MQLQVTAWPRIHGEKRNPGDLIEVDDPSLAKMLIREGQARPAGTPEPLAGGPAASQRAAQVDAGLADEPEPAGEGASGGEEGTGSAEPGPPPKPGRGASHDAWVAYAIGQGMDHENAKAMTRAQLVAHYAGS
ncbi:hypothetical protein [Actinomadura madurae]|uniref:hypothetical protein n=1 Tax=Actinomadura madurae TaxID=1993 RepID=UPI0020D22E66|nr:hypothetical protein [Actinomadura madurae]MCP9947276.1 hypothetical protein [Actinomadura madurae]MCP9964039.1 hypothetical protein [Actinomadura madurae]MCP9976514.1 hypothetical protein [Actinomadura madurae]MCQ0011990.1 hypothetical protein [Actinomadura madurae]MCQ0012709.1 hypothetical protein [Actinomadura madurae]